MANEIGQRFIAAAQVLILAALIFVVWQVRAMRATAAAVPVKSGELEWTVKMPGREPVKLTLDLYVDETEAEWEFRQEQALRRAEVVR